MVLNINYQLFRLGYRRK